LVGLYFQQYLSYIVAVSFIGGGNQSTRVPVASHWQTLSHNVVSSTPCHEWGSNSQL
jgi:hypothetical protein